MYDFRHPIRRFMNLKHSTVAIILVGEVVCGMLIFHAGAAYGERHAYRRMYGHGRGLPPPGFGVLTNSFIPRGHGAVGTIVNIATSTFRLNTRDGSQEIVLIDEHTAVNGPSGMVPLSSLLVGQSVAVVGVPDEDSDQIRAQLIRILSATPTTQTK